MGKLYSVIGDNITIVTVKNGLVGISTSATELASGGKIKIKRVEVGQAANATSAMLRLAFSKRDQAATLTHATAVTPCPLDVGGVASAILGNTTGNAVLCAGVGATADSGGTYINIHYATFNALNGYLWIPTPETEIIIHNTSVFCVRFLADPATLTGWTVAVIFEEL